MNTTERIYRKIIKAIAAKKGTVCSVDVHLPHEPIDDTDTGFVRYAPSSIAQVTIELHVKASIFKSRKRARGAQRSIR